MTNRTKQQQDLIDLISELDKTVPEELPTPPTFRLSDPNKESRLWAEQKVEHLHYISTIKELKKFLIDEDCKGEKPEIIVSSAYKTEYGTIEDRYYLPYNEPEYHQIMFDTMKRYRLVPEDERLENYSFLFNPNPVIKIKKADSELTPTQKRKIDLDRFDERKTDDIVSLFYPRYNRDEKMNSLKDLSDKVEEIVNNSDNPELIEPDNLLYKIYPELEKKNLTDNEIASYASKIEDAYYLAAMLHSSPEEYNSLIEGITELLDKKNDRVGKWSL